MIINEKHRLQFALEAQRDRTQPEQSAREQPDEAKVVYTLDYPDLNLLYEQKSDEEKKKRQSSVHPEPKPKPEFVPDLAEFFTKSGSEPVGQNPQTEQRQTDESDGKKAGNEDAITQQPELASTKAQPEAQADCPTEPKRNDAQPSKSNNSEQKPKDDSQQEVQQAHEFVAGGIITQQPDRIRADQPPVESKPDHERATADQQVSTFQSPSVRIEPKSRPPIRANSVELSRVSPSATTESRTLLPAKAENDSNTPLSRPESSRRPNRSRLDHRKRARLKSTSSSVCPLVLNQQLYRANPLNLDVI